MMELKVVKVESEGVWTGGSVIGNKAGCTNVIKNRLLM